MFILSTLVGGIGGGLLFAQSHLLHYDRPATNFVEALPIGNGTQGAMVYGDMEKEYISLNDITLWTGEPDTEIFTPDAATYLDSIRAALFSENYQKADMLQKNMQGHNSQRYQPLGALKMVQEFKIQEVQDYSRTLDISRAVAEVRFDGFRREYFASAADSVIVVRLTATDGKKINTEFRYSCQLPHTLSAAGNEIINQGYTLYQGRRVKINGKKTLIDGANDNRGIHFQTIVKVMNRDGQLTAKDSTLILSDCTEAIILIANATSFNGSDKDPVREGRDYKGIVRRITNRAAAKSYQQLLVAHEKDYKSYYDRVSIDLGTTDASIAAKTTEQQLKDYGDNHEKNPDLEELYFNFGRYLLISCSRTKEVPANLQGLWNEKLTPPWSSNYTCNINVEENYWPAEAAGLGDMHQSLLTWIQRLPITGEKTAKAYYGINEGWCSAHNSDIWAMTCPVGEHNDSPSWANWNMGGAWLSTHLWEHYAYTMDRDYLSSVYPVLKGAADFCMNWLIEHEGHLITAPATSPENIYITDKGYGGCTVYGGFADLAFIRECLIDTRNAAMVLGKDKKYIKKIDKTISQLLPYRIGKKGNLQEWYNDWEDKDPLHRHQSHLFGLYPGHHITLEDTPELAAACKRTLELKGDRTTGWSTGWRINLYAHLKDGEKAYKTYRTLLTWVSPKSTLRQTGGTYANLFDAHPPFQIDGNFGGCSGVMEMLVQSKLLLDGSRGSKVKVKVDLLPAIPEEWKGEGSVRGIRIRGGYTLDFSWKNGKVTNCTAYDRNGNVVTDNGKLIINN